MKRIAVFIILLFCFLNSRQAVAINEFKYLENEVTGEFCRSLLNEFDFPGFPQNQTEPFKLMTELIVEDISRVGLKVG